MTPAGGTGLGRPAALALLLVMGILWGLQFAMLKIAAEAGYSELVILMVALVLLSLAFSGLLIVRREGFTLDAARVRFLAVTAVLGYLVPLLAALHVAAHIPAGILTLIASLSPVVTVAVALALRTERVSRHRVFAVALGTAAALLVLWPDAALPGGGLYWLAVALLVPVCYGVESIYIAAKWPPGMTSLQAVAGESWFAALMVLPVFVLWAEPVVMPASWGVPELAIVMFVAAGVVESLIYFYLVRTTGGVFVSFGTFVSLFAGIGWGMVLFAESHGVAVWAAVIATCAAVGLLIMDRPEPAPSDGREA